MPGRLIREGLLDSERYWAVTLEARQLFWHLMLLADDLGCVSLAPVFIRRRCFDNAPSQDKINLLITHLMDVDLVRVYEVSGARYAFIPRYQQRLKRMTLKNPEPPASLLEGDEDAQGKFQEIRDKAEKRAARGQPSGGRRAAEVKRSEEKRRVRDSFSRFWTVYPRKVNKAKAEKAWLELSPDDQLTATIIAAVQCALLTDEWRKQEGQFVPYPSTWLSGRRWEDELAGQSGANDYTAGAV